MNALLIAVMLTTAQTKWPDPGPPPGPPPADSLPCTSCAAPAPAYAADLAVPMLLVALGIMALLKGMAEPDSAAR